MIKIMAADVSISKGLDGADALRFSENNSAVQFKIGKRVYDKRAENNHRYINIAVKAFGPMVERVQKMKLKEGSFIHVFGRLDEDIWEENGQKLRRFVVIADDIEFATGGAKFDKGGKTATGTTDSTAASNNQDVATGLPAQQNQQSAAPPEKMPTEQSGTPTSFTGYRSFGDENQFFPVSS